MNHRSHPDTNPKRERGRQTVASFTLRVGMGCLISDRVRYKHPMTNILTCGLGSLPRNARLPDVILIAPAATIAGRRHCSESPRKPRSFGKSFRSRPGPNAPRRNGWTDSLSSIAIGFSGPRIPSPSESAEARPDER